MYSDPKRRQRAGAVAPRLRDDLADGRVRLADAWATPLAEGGLWLEAVGALVVSDLHLEKSTAYARRGHLLPPYDTRATLARLAALIDRWSPRTLIALGDSFHDSGAASRLGEEDREALAALVRRVDWIWIAGNHDPAPPRALGGVVRQAVTLQAVTFRHEPTPGAAHEVAGHLHPCARVAGQSGAVRRRCFAFDGQRMVMPAFGAYAGGLNVLDKAFTPLFPAGLHALVLGRARVYPAAQNRLIEG
jgi:uncharacterized protein